MSNSEQMPSDAELYQRIDEVTHYLWDPIGISHFPGARDEYRSYLLELYARVKAGELTEILEYMRWVATERMGLDFDKDTAKKAAEVMLAWKKKIHGSS